MDITSEFQQANAGGLPVDWEVTPLGDCLSSRPAYGINAASVSYSDQLPVYIRITDITADGQFAPIQRVSVRSGMAANYYLSEGDIVFARTGASVGKSYRYRPVDGPLVYAGFLIRITPDSNKLLPEFAAAYVSTGTYWRWVRLMSMRSGQPGINGKEYCQLPIPRPSLAEQREIVAVLSDLNALLSGLDRLIAKKRDLKQAAMQQLLTGQTRLPGFSGEWEVKRLDKLADLYQPTTISAQMLTEGGYPVYGANGVVGFYHSANYHTWQVTVTCRGSTCGTVNRTVDECWITGNAMVVNCDNTPDLDKEFFYYLMLGQDFSDCITGTGQPQIVRSPLGAVRVALPTEVTEQSAIATVLSDIDAELASLEARRDKTRALKQAVMHELLTGKTRLPPTGVSHA